jgi:flagellar assembly protein FliH
MTVVIRSARVAAEVKMVPVTAPASDQRKPQSQQGTPGQNVPASVPGQNVPSHAAVHGKSHDRNAAKDLPDTTASAKTPSPGQQPVSATATPVSTTTPVSNATPASAQAHAVAPAQTKSPAPAAGITYEEYKQRFVGELAQIRQQALDAGREQGLQQGRLAAQAEFQQRLEALRAIIEGARNAHTRYVEDIADDAGEIVFAAICKILGDGFATRDAAVAAVREIVGRSKERARLFVRVSPEDFDLLNSRRRELIDAAAAGEVELVADEKVKLGGCLLEGPSGSLDARLELQLQRLREELVRARARWNEPHD